MKRYFDGDDGDGQGTGLFVEGVPFRLCRDGTHVSHEVPVACTPDPTVLQHSKLASEGLGKTWESGADRPRGGLSAAS